MTEITPKDEALAQVNLIEMNAAEAKALLYGVPKHEFSAALSRLAEWLAGIDDTPPSSAALSVPAAAVVGEPVGYVNADYKKELDCYDTAVLHPNDRSTKHFPMIPVYAATSDMEAARIGDEVLSWMVKYDLLDAGNEYRAEDVVAVLNDLAPYAAPSAPDGWQPIEMAPKDGTEILAYGYARCDGSRYANGQHIAWWDNDLGWTGRDPDDRVTLHLSHWRPLPIPPANGDSHE